MTDGHLDNSLIPQIKYQCLNCRGELILEDQRLICKRCGSFWPIVEGVPHFLNTAPYWGEISEDIFRDINNQIKAKYWRTVFEESDIPEVREAYIMIGNLRKANWHLLLDIDRNSRILDVGAGSGVLSHALSFDYSHIVALEPVLERIEFMKTRFQQDKRNNITLVRGDVLNLPFPESYFDLVVMSGVLEWVPLRSKKENPNRVQMAALRNILRVLKPGGILYLGVENRILAHYFFGKKDPHCQSAFVTILPRFLANIYSRIATGEPYRSYLYSSEGYNKLLRASGFSNVKIYGAFPGYNDPREIVPLDKNIYNFYLKYIGPPPITWRRQLFTKTVLSLGLIKYYGYAYIIFGSKR